jgi:uncharacterized protein
MKERRYTIQPVTIEMRDATELEEAGKTIKGYAAVFNAGYEMFEGYTERVLPGAFDGCDMSDVVALFNHNDEFLLGRSTNGKGTLTLSVDSHGLAFSVDAPNTTAGNDVAENIRLGNIQGCSFAFTVQEQKRIDNPDGTCIREISKISKLYDVGPVVFPAYTETEVEMCKRSIDSLKVVEVKQPNPEHQLFLLKLKKK